MNKENGMLYKFSNEQIKLIVDNLENKSENEELDYIIGGMLDSLENLEGYEIYDFESQLSAKYQDKL